MEHERPAAAARPPKRAHAAGIKREAASEGASAADGGLFGQLAANLDAAATEAPLTFKRLKRPEAAEGKPEAEQKPQHEVKRLQTAKQQPAEQQPAEKQQTAGQRGQKQRAKRPQPAQQSTRQQLQEAARRYTAKDGRRVSEPKLDPYDFHSSGSQPSAPQAVLVAAPAASGAAAAAADSPSVAAPPASSPAGHPAAHDAVRAAKQARSTAAERPAAVVTASDAGRGSSQDTAAASGRRIPGRLVPWACSACTFENPVGLKAGLHGSLMPSGAHDLRCHRPLRAP